MKRLFSVFVACFLLVLIASGAGAEGGKKKPTASSMPAATFKDPVTGMEFVYIKGGEFMMGAESIRTGEKDELPRHKVRLDGFYMGKYEVTQDEWVKVMGSNPSKFKRGGRYPVESVSWNDVQEFVAKLNEMSKGKRRYRLPTEAEWEYAARGGSDAETPWGKKREDACKYENIADISLLKEPRGWPTDEECDDGYTDTAPVGSFLPNGFGLYDTLGNVAEWCADFYGHDYYSHSPVENPKGPPIGTYVDEPCDYNEPEPPGGCPVGEANIHSIRGDSWVDRPITIAISSRGRRDVFSSDYFIGLRLSSSP